MRILEDHRLVWLSKPKTGSTTIRRMLDPYATIKSGEQRPYYHHSSLRMCLQDMAAAGISTGGYKFVVCERNPFTLIPSLWRYSRVNTRYQKFWQPDYDAALPLLGFGDFLRDAQTWEWFETRHRLELYTRAETDCPVHVFQIEDPAPMVAFLNAEIAPGAVPETLPRDNSSDYGGETLAAVRAGFADAAVTARVRRVFAASFERFAYANPWA